MKRTISDAAPERRSATVALVCALALLAGCSAPLPPAAPLRSRLELAPEATGAAGEAGPPAVVFAAPTGAALAEAEIAVVFNQPLRALELAADRPAIPARLEPSVPGRWEWVGTAAWRFVPEGALPAATHFTVTVPAGEIAPGRVLAAPYRWSFDSERPRLVDSTPHRGERGVLVEPEIRLTFNLPVDPAEVLRHLSLKGDGSKAPLPLELVPGERHAPEQLLVRPRAPLEPSRGYLLELAARLPAAAGPLPLGEAQRIHFETAGPLRVLDARCEPAHGDGRRCDPDKPITLRLTDDTWVDLVQAATIEPKVELWGEHHGSEREGASRGYRIHGPFAPATSYRLKLRAIAATADREAVELGAPFERTFVFGDRAPSVHLGGRGTFWPAAKALALELSSTNVSDAQLSAARLTPAQVVARLAGGAPALAFATPYPIVPGKRNDVTRSRVPLDALVDRGARGPLVVRASWRGSAPGDAVQTTEHELQRTDLGLLSTITARRVHVWVTRLSNGKPVSGAEIELRRIGPPSAADAVLARGRSDGQGLAEVEIPASVPRPTRGGRSESVRLVAFVRLGDDWAYQQLDTQAKPAGVGIAYTERGLYRPGEWVHLAGIERERRDGELVPPAGRPITVTVHDPAGREARRFQVTLSAFGSWHQSLRLPDTAPLGTYGVRATLGEHESRTRFTVAEYHPTAFTVAAAIDHDAFIRGAELTCVASGRYLHGGPMAGARARVELSRSRGSAPDLRALDGFSMLDPFAPDPPQALTQRTTALDRAGEHRERVRLALPEMNGPEIVSCRIHARDLDERELYEGDSAEVHPGEAYLGVRLLGSVAAGERFEAQVHAADLRGLPYAMAATVELTRRVTDPASGKAKEELLDRCEVQTGTAVASCNFLAPDESYAWGERELVVRARGVDRKGRPLRAAESLRPHERLQSAPTTPYIPERYVSIPRLGAHLDERERKPGELAQVLLSSPWTQTATALVRVRNDDIHWQKVVALPAAGTAVAVPVADSMIPEAEIDVVAVRGSDSEAAGAFLRVSHASKVLAVTVTPSRAEAEPGDEVEVAVEVRDASGSPARAEVTLYGADVATLWLANYLTPEPDRMWLVGFEGAYQTRDARENLFDPAFFSHRTRPPRVRMGGTHVGNNDVRGDFRQTVFFATGLVTDAQGLVKRRVRLPDGLTTYRFMAVVATADDRFGSGQAEVVTKKALMVRPKLPAVVRSGDRFEVAALVTSSGAPRADVEVGLAARGLTLEGPASTVVDVEADVAKRVVFRVRATKAGPFELKLRVSAPFGEARDAVVTRGEVVAPTFLETVALYGDTEVAVAEALGDLSAIRKDVGELTLTLARTRLGGLDRDIGGLLEYPYGCTEQTASRLLPLASLRGLSREVGVTLPPDATRRVTDAVERLRSHQRGDGGFGFWPGSRASHPWLSAYTTWVLREASRAGTPVPEDLLTRATDYLRVYLLEALPSSDPASADVDDGRLATATFMVDVLASTPSPPTATMSRLFAVRNRLPAFARALLLHAMTTASHPAADERRLLLGELASGLRLDGDAAHAVLPREGASNWLSAVLASEPSSTALVLRALLAADPAHPMAPKLVTGLLAGLRARTATTHERAWALVALDAYRRAHPSSRGALEARVFLGEQLVGEVELDTEGPAQQTLALPAAAVAKAGKGARLTFDVEGGKLHYQARLRYARRQLPTQPLAAGMQLFKRVARLEPFTHQVVARGDASLPLYAGDLVRVDLQVVLTSPRRVVAIDDPLPGGLMPIDPNLRTGLEESGARIWDHRELRDDRVVFFVDDLPAGIHTFSYWARAQNPGRFVAPPAQAFEMYAPEVRGATAAATVTVTERGASAPSDLVSVLDAALARAKNR